MKETFVVWGILFAVRCSLDSEAKGMEMETFAERLIVRQCEIHSILFRT